MAYFFQIRLNQKIIAAKYTNYPQISKGKQKLSFDLGKLTLWKGCHPSAGMAYFLQTRLKGYDNFFTINLFRRAFN